MTLYFKQLSNRLLLFFGKRCNIFFEVDDKRAESCYNYVHYDE